MDRKSTVVETPVGHRSVRLHARCLLRRILMRKACVSRVGISTPMVIGIECRFMKRVHSVFTYSIIFNGAYL